MLIKFAKLTVLVFLALFAVSQNSAGASNLCGEQVVSRWNQCDGGYTTTAYNYFNYNTYCTNVALAACHPDTNQSSSCFVTNYNNCVTSVSNAWNNRADAYSNCLSPQGLASNCMEELENHCPEAMNRYNLCGEIYEDDIDAAMACRSASGYGGAPCI